MNWFYAFCIVSGLFIGLAVVALKEEAPSTAAAVGYSASDRAGMDKLIEQVTVPEIRKLPRLSKLPPKKGLHWVSLAKAASQTDGESFNDYLDMAGKGILR